MSNNLKYIFIAIIVVIVFGGLWLFLGSGEDARVTDNQSATTSESTDEISSNSQNEDTKVLEPSSEASAGSYVDYSEEKVANTKGNKVLFFYASWCPTCKALDQNIRAGVVPEGLTIFKVNYDTERDLAKKYGVTYQHTLVQVDKNGEQINKWAGSYTIDQIVDELI